MNRRAAACAAEGAKNSTGFSGCSFFRKSVGLDQIVFESPIGVFPFANKTLRPSPCSYRDRAPAWFQVNQARCV
jgi:hypothetical protein